MKAVQDAEPVSAVAFGLKSGIPTGLMRVLRPDGQLCLVATPLQRLPLSAGMLYEYARRRIYGNYVGSRAETATMLDFAAAHGIAAEVTVLPFSSVNEAIERVRSRGSDRARPFEPCRRRVFRRVVTRVNADQRSSERRSSPSAHFRRDSGGRPRAG